MKDNKKIIENKKCQASLEYVLLAGFILIVLAGVLILSSKEIGSNTALTHAEDFVITIANNVDEVHALGEGSRKYVDVRIPSSTQSINISGKEVSLSYNSQAGLNEIYKTTKANMTGEIDVTRAGSVSRIIIEMKSDNTVFVNST